MALFITFEGVEGCGKSTQSRLLYNRLRKKDQHPILVHEPGCTPLGDKLTRLLKTFRDITPLAELFLFNASRAQLVETVIRPHLEGGNLVICDRFTDSTIAYQGYGRGISSPMIESVDTIATGGLHPNLTILLDVAPEQGLRRKRKVNDRFEEETLEFHQKVRDGYLQLASQEPERWLVLDGTRPKAVLADIILGRVTTLANCDTVVDKGAR